MTIMPRSPRPPGRKELSHERIVATAARAIRRAGFDGVGVADIMKEAGLTHGGFYAHFPSRAALVVEALERATEESARSTERAAAAPGLQGASLFRRLVLAYLSDEHLKAVEQGCPVAALVSEMPRQAVEVRKASALTVRDLLSRVKSALPHRADAGPAIASQLVGGLQLARALGANAEGRALLAAVRERLLAEYDG